MASQRLLGGLRGRNEPEKQEYVYEPIPDGEYIRILELNPGTGTITGQLKVISLDEAAGTYEAISYSWGDNKNATNILIEDKNITVTVNLYNALLSLREKDSLTPRILWADALCINQKDKKEQSKQVQFMGKIYRSARAVPIWLGNDEQQLAKVCFGLCKKTATASRELLSKYGYPTRVPKQMANPPFSQDARSWAMMCKLMGLSWFRRVWVKQEAGLAARAILILGTETMDMEDLVEIAFLNHERGDLFPSGLIPIHEIRNTFIEVWRSYGNTPSWRENLSPWIYEILKREKESTFTNLLHQGRMFKATDPRDHIYGFLGHPSTRHPETNAPLVTVDYQKSIFEVYYEAARAIIDTRPQDITFMLSCVDRDEDALNDPCPSWVSQWHRCNGVSCFGYPGECRDIPDVQFSVLEDRSLKLRGVVFDEVEWIGPRMGDDDFLPASVASKDGRFSVFRSLIHRWPFGRTVPLVQRLWQDILRQGLSSRYGGKHLDAFLLTMVAAWKIPESGIPQHRANFAAYCNATGAVIEGLTANTEAEDSLDGNVWAVELDICWANRGRRFFCTKSGYFGIGHYTTRPGDVCCVFMRSRLPFILRPMGQSSSYKLIGNAYIHGASKGEILETENPPVQDVIIQ